MSNGKFNSVNQRVLIREKHTCQILSQQEEEQQQDE